MHLIFTSKYTLKQLFCHVTCSNKSKLAVVMNLFLHIVKFCILLYMHILTGGCSGGFPGTDFWNRLSHQLLTHNSEPFRLVLDGSQFLPFLWVSHHSGYQPLLPNPWLLPAGPQQGVQDGSSGQLARVLCRVVYSTR